MQWPQSADFTIASALCRLDGTFGCRPSVQSERQSARGPALAMLSKHRDDNTGTPGTVHVHYRFAAGFRLEPSHEVRAKEVLVNDGREQPGRQLQAAARAAAQCPSQLSCSMAGLRRVRVQVWLLSAGALFPPSFLRPCGAVATEQSGVGPRSCWTSVIILAPAP